MPVRTSRPRPYPFGPRTVAAVLDDPATRYPERLALVDGDRTWTYSELTHAVDSIAPRLPSHRIAWSMPNTAELVIAFLATMRAGKVWIAVDPRLEAAEQTSRSELTGVERTCSDIDKLPADECDSPPADIDPHAAALIAFTSGTGGRPKAVVHSQHNLLWPGLISSELEPPSDRERIGTPLSLSTANMMLLGPLSAFLRGSSFVVMRRTHAAGFASDVEEHEVSRAFVVPTMLHDMLESDEEPTRLRSLDRIIAGGSAGDAGVLTAFSTRFGVRPTLSYGLSEAPTGVVRESLDDPIGSGRGFPLPLVEIVVVDSDGNPVENGVEGQICVRAASSGSWRSTWSPMLGYLGDDDATEAALRNGMLHTRDRGQLDEDGAVSIVGRLDDLIIRGGANIDPREVETALLRHPGVREAAVVGVPDGRFGQVVGAAISVNHDTWVDVADLEESIRPLLGSHKSPERIIILEQIPKNVMGKHDRFAILELL